MSQHVNDEQIIRNSVRVLSEYLTDRYNGRVFSSRPEIATVHLADRTRPYVATISCIPSIETPERVKVSVSTVTTDGVHLEKLLALNARGLVERSELDADFGTDHFDAELAMMQMLNALTCRFELYSKLLAAYGSRA